MSYRHKKRNNYDNKDKVYTNKQIRENFIIIIMIIIFKITTTTTTLTTHYMTSAVSVLFN